MSTQGLDNAAARVEDNDEAGGLLQDKTNVTTLGPKRMTMMLDSKRRRQREE